MENLREFVLRFVEKGASIRLWREVDTKGKKPIYELLNTKRILAKELCQIEELCDEKVYFIKSINCENKGINLVIKTKYTPSDIESFINKKEI